MLNVMNPIYPPDPVTNPYVATTEQMTFIYIHYPDYAKNPLELLMWLYETAVFQENQAFAQIQAEAESAYNQKPKNGARKVKKNNNNQEEEEDTTFGVKAPKKPSVQTGKEISFEVLQKRDKLQKKSAENQAKKDLKKQVQKIKPGPTVVNEQLVDVDETREPASMVFIGHVDSGKSTISGNLMFIMGVVDQRTIQKYKEEAKEKNRESWWLAYVMDVNEEEKAKGKTVEVGRATFDTPKKRYTIFDAPGHKNYVPNMIMGAALADFGTLVISAKKGEFESGFELDG